MYEDYSTTVVECTGYPGSTGFYRVLPGLEWMVWDPHPLLKQSLSTDALLELEGSEG